MEKGSARAKDKHMNEIEIVQRDLVKPSLEIRLYAKIGFRNSWKHLNSSRQHSTIMIKVSHIKSNAKDFQFLDETDIV